MLRIDDERVPPEEGRNLVVVLENVDILVRRKNQGDAKEDLKIPCESTIRYVSTYCLIHGQRHSLRVIVAVVGMQE